MTCANVASPYLSAKRLEPTLALSLLSAVPLHPLPFSPRPKAPQFLRWQWGRPLTSSADADAIISAYSSSRSRFVASLRLDPPFPTLTWLSRSLACTLPKSPFLSKPVALRFVISVARKVPAALLNELVYSPPR